MDGADGAGWPLPSHDVSGPGGFPYAVFARATHCGPLPTAVSPQLFMCGPRKLKKRPAPRGPGDPLRVGLGIQVGVPSRVVGRRRGLEPPDQPLKPEAQKA